MSAFDVRIVWDLTADRSKAVIQMLKNGKELANISLEAPELDEMIDGLGRIRAHMAEQVSPALDPGTIVLTVSDPAWLVEPSKELPGILLALRHTGLGWLGYLLPRHEAQALAR